MGIPLSSVTVVAPPWLPSDDVSAVVKKKRASKPQDEPSAFRSAEKRLCEIPGVKSAEVVRKRWLLGLFTFTEASVTPEPRGTRPRISGKIPPGIVARVRFCDAPTVTEFAFRQSRVGGRAFVLQGQRARGLSTERFRIQRREWTRAAQAVTSDSIELSIDSHSVALERVYLNEAAQRPSMLYYDPEHYLQLRCDLSARHGLLRARPAILLPLDGKSLAPNLLLRLNAAQTGRFAGALCGRIDVGAILSTSPVPFTERFSLGGPPSMRGVPPGEFSVRSGGAPACSDFFAIASSSVVMNLVDNVNFQFFAHAGVAGLSRSNYFLDVTPSCAYAVSYGGGYLIDFRASQLEINFSVPALLSPGIPFAPLQWKFFKK